jgi:hypothetical protein
MAPCGSSLHHGGVGDRPDPHASSHARNVTSELRWRQPEREGTALISLEGSDRAGATHRFLLDQSPLNTFPYCGWEVCWTYTV